MRCLRVFPMFAVVVLALFAASCADGEPPTALSPDAAVASMHGGGPGAVSHQFIAPMSGAQEVPAADTRARGQTTFRLSADGLELSYRLVVANLHDVTMAHIHRAPAGVNGPVVVWLYPSEPHEQLIEGRSSGVLATGTITADDLVGQLAGGTVEDLVALMRAGETYVNVHTSAYPGGEIRGQIR
jgi:hypothetical protein